jgi:small GTP-binding protein
MNEYMIKILTLGDTTVGKTSIVLQYTTQKYNTQILSTIGVDFKSKVINIDNNKVKMLIWDTAGEERFRNIASQYYNGADGALLIFDITKKSSFERIVYWINELSQKKNINELGLLLVGNKIDLEKERQVQKEEAERFAKENNLKYYEVSAAKNINIDNMMLDIIKQCVSNIQKRDSDAFRDSINDAYQIISDIQNKKNKNCC